jgi:hypothetical protein
LRACAAALATLPGRSGHLQSQLIDRPPGHELAEQKVTKVIPMKVGIISSSRRTM